MSALPLMLLFLSAVALTSRAVREKQKQQPFRSHRLVIGRRLMDTVQRRTFLYFWEGAEPNSGLLPNVIMWTAFIQKTMPT